MLKKGVSVNGIKGEIVIALIICSNIFHKYGMDMIVTSCTDGNHGRGSLHYVGYAVDLRIRHLSKSQLDLILRDIKEALTIEYDIVLEPTHIHIEYQPK